MMRHFTKTIAIIIISPLFFMMSGCAAITAIQHPSKKDIRVLNSGTNRENVIAYLGPPASFEKKGDKTIELYQFEQGYSGANKATRASIHLILDAFTLFIWELVGWPAELVFNGEKHTVRVVYDQDNRVEDVTYIKKEGR